VATFLTRDALCEVEPFGRPLGRPLGRRLGVAGDGAIAGDRCREKRGGLLLGWGLAVERGEG